MWKTVTNGTSGVEPAVRQFLPPCQVRCPINEDIQRTNMLIAMLPENPDRALEGIIQIGDYLYEKNPLFTVCGYVCGLCELECNYHAMGGAIKRRLLKRFISDTYTDYLNQKTEFNLVKQNENVAVVGGGPAGLMCAYDLSKRGFRVTIFEASERLGGALWLIPRYRLPETVLTSCVENLVQLAGIDVKYKARVGEGRLTLEKLKNQGFRAVFVAEGTPLPRTLAFLGREVEGQDYSGVMYGHTFLYEVSHGNIQAEYFKDKEVVVIGGGNVAFDVARTTRRMGGRTTLVCLECEDKSCPDGIPADKEEIRGAWEEGVRTLYSRGVSRILGKGEKVTGLACPSCTRVFDDKGFSPEFDMEDVLTINADVLIITVGQGPDLAGVRKDGLLDERGRMPVDPLTLQSARIPYVFVGGDLKRTGFMVDAMHDGLVAAESIERYIKGLDLGQGRKRFFATQDIPLRRFYSEEPEVLWIPPEKRMHFQVFERGFTLTEAIEEAKRCTACGPCISCKACVSVGIQKSLPFVEVLEDRCCGCGICVAACYYDAAHLKPAGGDKKVSITDSFQCKSCGMCVVACPSGARVLSGDDTEVRITAALDQLGI